MQRLRILLINPPQIHHVSEKPVCAPPLGLAYMAAVLEKAFDVKITDCIAEGFEKKSYVTKEINRWGVDPDELNLRVTRWEPDIVGISCTYSPQEEVIFDIAAVYKRFAEIRGKNIITVVGGPHATAVPFDIMKHKDVDFVVTGEGEIPMFQLCQAIQSNMDVSGIHGLAYRDHTGKVMVNPRSEYIDNPDKIPFPARHLLLMDKYLQAESYFKPRFLERTNMILSRGCDSRCLFCTVPGCFGGKFRPRSADNIIAEMKEIIEKYAIKEVCFEDDNFFRNLDIATELCSKMTDNKLNLAWGCHSGLVARGYSNKLIELMKQSGCYRVTLNLESGCDNVLGKILNSPNDRNIAANMILALEKAGIEVAVNFRIGFPGETQQEIMETFSFISKFKVADVKVFFAVPFPGTPFQEQCNKEGLFIRPVKYRDYLLESTFLRTEEFDPQVLQKLHEVGMKNLWKKRATSDAGVLFSGVGSVLEKTVLHPFSSKEKKR
ncbi:MAG: B12-binding domain-containing radical SAM protein [Firmicutes bacterium]|nr:B12-binding domain-containing radical SAM protein [Bacillota bacterium]